MDRKLEIQEPPKPPKPPNALPYRRFFEADVVSRRPSPAQANRLFWHGLGGLGGLGTHAQRLQEIADFALAEPIASGNGNYRSEFSPPLVGARHTDA